MKKILLSVSVIAVVAAVVLGVTTAFFSDTETSTGNTFTAGSLDLKVDSQQHYNNAVCNLQGVWELEVGQTATVPQYPVIGQPCTGTWGQTPDGKDIVGEKFFNFADVKPGDSGENTISLHVINNDAWVCAEVKNLANADNGITEPESAVDATDGVGNGELQDKLILTVWRDNGDNIRQDNEPILATGKPVNGVLAVYDSTTGAPLPGGSTTYLGVSWSLPSATGNEVQTDSMTGDISFYVEQARNNSKFRCIPPTPIRYTKTLSFNPVGWAGYSCPMDQYAVGAGVLVGTANAYLWQPGVTVGTYTYPLTPFGYSYAAGETGMIIQNDGDMNETITYYVDCLPK
jgi:predicted ribosomally synthesized peptide with SipW-like signal peptide